MEEVVFWIGSCVRCGGEKYLDDSQFINGTQLLSFTLIHLLFFWDKQFLVAQDLDNRV